MIRNIDDETSKNCLKWRQIAVVVLSVMIHGCGDDGGGGGAGSSSGGSGGASTSTTTSNADSTGASESTGDGGMIIPDPPTNTQCDNSANGDPIPAGSYQLYLEGGQVPEYVHPLPNLVQTNSLVEIICPELDLIDGLDADTDSNLTVRVYRPDPWPAGPVPFVVHHHGAGQSYDNYGYIGTRLAEEGYVFLSISRGSDNEEVEQAIACTMSWIGSTEAEGGAALFTDGNGDSRLRCDAIIMGHSQGGNGARHFVRNRETEFLSPYWFDFQAAAYVGLAPSNSNAAPLLAELELPIILFGAGFDGDTGNPVTLYDQMPPEEDRLSQTSARVLVWVQDAVHDSFGGLPISGGGVGVAAVTEYLPRFLQWHLEHENVAQNRRILHFEEFPEPLNDPDYHDNADSYGELGFRDCAPLDETECAPTFGCFWDAGAAPAAACVELICADHAVPGDCEAMSGCAEWNGGCVPRPAIYGMYTIDTDAADSFVEEVEYFEGEPELAGPLVAADQALVGDVLSAFMPLFNLASSNHETSAMLVSWGSGLTELEGSVSLAGFSLGAGVPTASHLSIRMANLVSITGDCEPVSTEPVTVGVRLRSEDQGPGDEPTYFDTPLLPVQEVHGLSGLAIDCTEQTMSTVRIPMARFCEDDILDTSAIDEIEFFFDDHGLRRDVLIDSIEFTRHPDDIIDPQSGTLNVCPIFSGVYACPATPTLTALQTACSAEPSNGACPAPDVVTTSVAIPWADDGASGFSGWLIHAPTGIIDDEQNLNASEQAFLDARCVQACEDEWDDDPFVDANCDATGAFGTPSLVVSPSVGTRQAIPIALQDGSGLFGTQVLPCSLHDSCCQAFDERAICPAAPARVTPARDPLGDGQEWEFTVDGTTSADSSFASGPVSATMVGTIGYSFCTEGDQVDCPFYLGSMHLELTEALSIDLTCNGVIETHTISQLDIDLVQPALGIGEAGTSWKAFPPRALVVEAVGIADGLPIAVRNPIETAVEYQAGEGWTLLQGGGGAYIKLNVPCNGEIADIILWWGFEEDLTTASPPSVGLNLPNTVVCPGQLDLLLATGTDPDGDLDSLQWIVDGVLMSEEWPTIDFTQNHEITAVLGDARGAADSDTKTVSCQ